MNRVTGLFEWKFMLALTCTRSYESAHEKHLLYLKSLKQISHTNRFVENSAKIIFHFQKAYDSVTVLMTQTQHMWNTFVTRNTFDVINICLRFRCTRTNHPHAVLIPSSVVFQLSNPVLNLFLTNSDNYITWVTQNKLGELNRGCQFITNRTFFPNSKIFFQAITAKYANLQSA